MLKKFINALFSDPFLIAYHVGSKLWVLWISLKRSITIEGDLTVIAKPLIDIRKGSRLYLGNGVVLNSRNKGYHINMHSPVKLFADREGAEIRIGSGTRVHGTCIHAYKSITIGENCLIAANCQIIDGSGHDLSFPDVENRVNTTGNSRPILIEDSVWIGANSIVLPGVTIGRGAVISANSLVSKDIPPMVVAAGNPAVIVKDFRGEPSKLP